MIYNNCVLLVINMKIKTKNRYTIILNVLFIPHLAKQS